MGRAGAYCRVDRECWLGIGTLRPHIIQSYSNQAMLCLLRSGMVPDYYDITRIAPPRMKAMLCPLRRDMVPDYYDMASLSRSEEEVGALRQVSPENPTPAALALRTRRPSVGGSGAGESAGACQPGRVLRVASGRRWLLARRMLRRAASRRFAFMSSTEVREWLWRPQVAVDVPRTAPGVPFFHTPKLQKSLERILYIWGIRCGGRVAGGCIGPCGVPGRDCLKTFAPLLFRDSVGLIWEGRVVRMQLAGFGQQHPGLPRCTLLL